MQASAARAYAKRFGVAAGGRVLVFGAHDEAYGAALDLMAAGVELRGLVDPRAERSPMADKLEAAGAEVLQGQAVVKAEGGQTLRGAQIATIKDGAIEGHPSFIDCDLLCSAGGWSPTLHLHSHALGKTVWDDRLATFLPGEVRAGIASAGAA